MIDENRSRPVGTVDIEPQDNETIGFDNDFIKDGILCLDKSSDALTLTFIHFLQNNGYEVHKMGGPVAMYEGHSVLAKSFRLNSSDSIPDNFQTLLEKLQSEGATKVFVYVAMVNYAYIRSYDEETFEPTGEQEFSETRIIRMDWI